MSYSDAKLAKLIAMSRRATQGEWWGRPGLPYIFAGTKKYTEAPRIGRFDYSAFVSDTDDLGNDIGSGPDGEFVTALVNWFRETYT
jgi:hypothetical protein